MFSFFSHSFMSSVIYTLSKLLEGKTGKSKEVYIEKTRNINLLMHDMNEAEKNGKEDIDAMAGLFGKVMAQIVACREDEWTENLQRFGFFLGKFIYLLDAYEDIEEDIKKNRYKKLRFFA